VEFRVIVIGHKQKPLSDKMQAFLRLVESCSVLSAFHAISLFIYFNPLALELDI